MVTKLICIWCRKVGDKNPHFWRYLSKLHVHCEKCCGKALNFAIKNNVDFNADNHFVYGGPDKYPEEKIITNKKSKKVWPGTLSLRLSYEDADYTDHVKDYHEPS